ncbi:uncharacterized protein [Fopius arisanus]|uniref:BTB domain-containing protein n=1 Tax=Fopius arisanus TaxID=64838 RepID=A0A9R1TPB9_9HYME|nr:PREDICTED: uncharacterized protein LOC105272403 [Fopius arisanus]
MVETGREYVLQWSGHAANITERFSGLLARQALVDVTLLCQNQELRVHKLVLASCSLYFEEMLEQDLGQEPTIILNDLHFNILKAMIEFMYCGETTIAHCHLQSLLNAAQVFKVKHLESLVASIIDSNLHEETPSDSLDSQDSEIEDESSYSALNSSSEIQSPENVAENFESTNIFEDLTLSSDSPPDNGNTVEQELDTWDNSSPVQSPEIPDESHQNVSEKSHDDQLDSPGGIGECSRVYIHKKRKCSDERRDEFLSQSLFQLQESSTTTCIDLSYDKNCDISPVTLPSVDLESEYIFNLNSDNFQPLSPPYCSITDRYKSIYDDLDIQRFTPPSYNNIRKIKELFSDQNQCNNIGNTPVLRRSVRLNQLENDDTVNNNSEAINCKKTKDFKKQQLKHLKKFNKIKSIKLNGKSKDSESRISDENRKHVINSRPLRSNRKIVTKSSSKFSLSREEPKGKNTKIKIEKIKSLDKDDFIPVKLNTIASVDRSLWGDMSDLLENCQNNAVLPDYSQSKEIPFAVGLLPLRAALERMQAIPDYQPRKTRSSVAPYKVDSCGLKRKANGDIESIVISKKQCSPERSIESDTVCHIQIHTSSQCSQSNEIVQAKPFISVEPASDKR